MTKALDLMQGVVGSNPGLDKFFFHIFFTKTDCKSLYIEKGNPCADYRETLFGLQGNHVGITGKPLFRLQGNPCWDYRENLLGLQGNPCRNYRETPVRITGIPCK